MMTTMTRIVAGQRIQVGTLKAMGFKKSVILRHYIAYNFFLAFTGAVLGLITGPLCLPPLFYPSMSGFYTLPEWKPTYHQSFIWVSIILVLLCTLVSWLACGKLLRDTPADTLRPKAPKVFRHGWLEQTKLWQKFSFNAQWNWRDASRNRIRSLMAIIGVFGCTALVVCAFGMRDGMEDLKVWQYSIINHYESHLTLDETITPEQTDIIILSVNGEAIMENRIEVRANDIKKSASLLVTDNTTLIQSTDINLKPVQLPENGISITMKLAELLEVKKGDSIDWHIYGSEKWITSTIEAVYRDPLNQGITLSRRHLESLGMVFHPTSILSAEKITNSMKGINFITSTEESLAGWNDLTESMYLMVYILILAAAILSVVVLYNLGLLSFTEMERELATLKVMGLKSGKLRGLLLTQNLWFSIVGFSLGVPGGMILTDAMISYSGEAFDFPLSLHLMNFLISFAFTFGLSILVNLMFSKKIRKLNMVESLKSTE